MQRSVITTIALLAGLGLAYSVNAQTTTPPSSAASPPTMTQNQSQGNVSKQQIEQAQQDLKKAGVYKGQIDGEMGPETKQAVEQFQKQKGITPTGSLDEQTLQALNGQGGTTTQGGTIPPTTNQPKQ